MEAHYRFAVRFRLPEPEGMALDPAEFETALRYRAARPGEEGWLFFRDHLWRGGVNDPDHLRSLLGESLGVRVTRVEFRALEADREYLDALRAAAGDHLGEFRAGAVDAALTKYLGSAIEVQAGG